MHSFYPVTFLVISLLFSSVILLLHVKSFLIVHNENDEVVYLSLASRMNWDLTNYTTRNVPIVRDFPYSIYRQPLFHQPPLFPLVLKIGGLLGNPVGTGLVFANLSMILLLFYTWRWMAFTRTPPQWAVVAFAASAFCPLLLATTTMLHIDGLLGIYLACAVVSYIEALDRPTLSSSMISGLFWVVALNLRYNSLIALPLICLLQAYQLFRLPSASDVTCSVDNTATHGLWHARKWKAFAIVLTLVLLPGLQHYYRVLATYGTLLPSRIVVPDSGVEQFNEFLKLLSRRGPWQMALLLISVFPFLLLLTTRWFWSALILELRAGLWTPVPLTAFLLLFLIEYLFSYKFMRYFAAEMPLLYLSLPFVFRSAPPRWKPFVIGLGCLSLLLMVVTGFARTIVAPLDAVEIIPAIYYYIPQLMRYYR
jgi:hypothetical protein